MESENSKREQVFEAGRRLLEQGRADEALRVFRAGSGEDPEDARARSYYGLCLGVVERRFDAASELCRSAVKQEFFNPELYLNLARLHLGFGFKTEAIRHLRRGQMIDPGNQAIQVELHALGQRRPQAFGFLPRRHLLNRLLGRFRSRAQLDDSAGLENVAPGPPRAGR